ncbi:hypothetical protein ACIBEF_16255 [Micromonospora sp. NPDC050795]|uniref:hypothetical protein n=1 Tax=Micromonospora sp. NPDC050795 TaxID=3364282 RepID=UPI0037954BC1
MASYEQAGKIDVRLSDPTSSLATMANQRGSIQERVRRALYVLSRGRCYAPGCAEPVIVLDGEEAVFVGEIAHIIGASTSGPRGQGALTNREVFANLLLLCGRHHKIIDGRQTRDRYPPDVLQKWKSEREREFDTETLADLNRAEFSAKELPQKLLSSFKEATAELSETVNQLEKAGRLTHDAAEMLRSAVAHIPTPDSEFHRSAMLLANFADALPSFDRSARALGLFVDAHPSFGSAANSLGMFVERMPAHVLSDASTAFSSFSERVDIHRMAGAATSLEAVLGNMPNPEEYRQAGRELANNLSVVNSLADAENPSGAQQVFVTRNGLPGPAILALLVVAALAGILGTVWIGNKSRQGAEDARQACTGPSIPPNFKVTRQIEVEATPSLSPSPFVCETWYPPPITRTSQK